jgi:hypothetical protein
MCAPVRAHADDGDWYGWQIIGVDAAGISALVAGMKLGGEAERALTTVGVMVLMFGGPAVHASHDRHFKVVGGSFGLRLGGALVAFIVALLGHARAYPDEDNNGSTYVAAGIVGAVLLADWFLLANPDDESEGNQSFGLSFGSTF